MKSAKIAETSVVILETGEEAFAALTKFANDAGITAASLTAIGAFEKATVGTRGGHLLEGKVRPTLEVVLTETPDVLRRKKRADIGIALIDLNAKR